MSPKERILVIEDDESIRENIADILEYEEYEVFTSADGEEGIRLATDLHPDLILCDINMPSMDGYEVLKKLREDPDNKDLPFVFLTAHGERSEIRKGMDLGADDYLTKPFKTADLLGAVETRLAQRRKRREVHRKQWSEFSDEISSMIPHELRTPLNSLCSLTQFLRDDWENMDSEEINEYLDLMNESGKRLRKVTENLSLYAHLRSLGESEEAPKHSESTEPEELDFYLLPIAQSIASEYGRSDDLIFQNEPVSPISRDASLVGKACREIIDNAFKFSPKGTPVEVTLDSTGPTTVIRIKDQGEGMTSQQILRIGALIQFERRRKEQQGIDIGLALARQIIEYLGGSLALESSPNEGLTATLQLPA